MTTLSNKAIILSDLWLNYRQDEDFIDFVEYNDIGLPLAYMLANNIVEMNPMAQKFIEESFDLLLAGLGIEDADFQSLDDVLDQPDIDNV